MLNEATFKIPPFFRRGLAAALATGIVFLIVRFLFQLEINGKLFLIALVSSLLGSIISKELHKYIVKEGE